MATTLNAATFMGKNFSTIQSVVKNHESLTLKRMFDVTAQLVNNQEEINCLDKILYGKNSSTRLSLIEDDIVINLQRTKVYVFSDSVLCLSEVLQHPESNEAWKNSPQGAWDNIAEQMLLEFAEGGHPIFRATTPLAKCSLKSKGRGKLSIHFDADQDN